MRIPMAKDGWPWIIVPLLIGAVLCWAATALAGPGRMWMCVAGGFALAISLYMLYFHRDPTRHPPQDPQLVLAGADGVIRRVEHMPEPEYIGGEAVRISIYLNPLNVHTNRMPIAGTIKKLGYTPGKHLLTILNSASEHNEHSTILVENERTRCLMRQIVGPIVRRVVYWLKEGQTVGAGEVFGMMKFGSRLDTYLPVGEVAEVCVKPGDKVTAGLTVVARLKQ